jgi:type IV pilus assembly protein PilY1
VACDESQKTSLVAVAALVAIAPPRTAQAQSSVTEDFTGTSTSNSWYFFNGACLTAGSAAGVEPTGAGTGQLPGCTTIASSYYNKTSGEVLVGGFNGTFPDPAGSGVPPACARLHQWLSLRLQREGHPCRRPLPTAGVSITFKTVTYRGNSGGGGGDGADGISFFLMDASKLDTSIIPSGGTAAGDGNGLGSFGGSLGYSCSNSNNPYNGLNGGYLGLGIDEYGNFLNGTVNTLGETGTTASGDNTNTGGGYQPGRIGLRGAGSISFLGLTAAYGSNPNNSAKPYYPASLSTSCGINGGVYNATLGSCMWLTSRVFTRDQLRPTTCSSGTYNATSICARAAASASMTRSPTPARAQAAPPARTTPAPTCARRAARVRTMQPWSCARYAPLATRTSRPPRIARSRASSSR